MDGFDGYGCGSPIERLAPGVVRRGCRLSCWTYGELRRLAESDTLSHTVSTRGGECELTFIIGPSRLGCALAGATYFAVSLGLVWADWPLWIKSVLLALVVCDGWRACARFGHWGRGTIPVGLQWLGANGFLVAYRNEPPRRTTVVGNVFVHPWLVVVRLRMDGDGHFRSQLTNICVVVCADMCTIDEHRRLRSLLRTRGST
jgi:hypothetical protein